MMTFHANSQEKWISKMTSNPKFITPVSEEYIEEGNHDQRIDNFFLKKFKQVPKSHLYQLIRSGQVRVNGKRITANYRLQLGDYVRIPPIKLMESNSARRRESIASENFFSFNVVYEDDAILVIDKPCGMAVHGGSGISFGVIEQLRAQNPTWKFLELVHRLDRETSGLLLLAKKRGALVELHRQIRAGLVEKHYLTMVKGQWLNARQHVKLPLNKFVTTTGERRVAVAASKSEDNKALYAHTIFTLQKNWESYSLLDAEIKTGRTHQIRVHLAYLGYPIIGDDKYGDFELNKRLAKAGTSNSARLIRMFLHASSIQFTHPVSGEIMKLQSALSNDLKSFVARLSTQQSIKPCR